MTSQKILIGASSLEAQQFLAHRTHHLKYSISTRIRSLFFEAPHTPTPPTPRPLLIEEHAKYLYW